MSIRDRDAFTILRAQAGAFVKGRYGSVTRVEIPDTGNIQPAKEDQITTEQDYNLKSLTKTGCVDIFNGRELFSDETSTLSKADVIVFAGKMYKVISSSGERTLAGRARYKSEAEFLEVLDDGDGEPVVGDPYQAGRVEVSKSGDLVGKQPEINFIEGPNILINITEDSENSRIDITLSVDGSLPEAAGLEIVSAEDLLRLNIATTDGFKADSANVNHRNKLLGIMTENVDSGFSGTCQTSGELVDSSWNFTPGTVLFLNGTSLSIVPPSTGFSCEIARVIEPTKIFVLIKDSLLL